MILLKLFFLDFIWVQKDFIKVYLLKWHKSVNYAFKQYLNLLKKQNIFEMVAKYSNRLFRFLQILQNLFHSIWSYISNDMKEKQKKKKLKKNDDVISDVTIQPVDVNHARNSSFLAKSSRDDSGWFTPPNRPSFLPIKCPQPPLSPPPPKSPSKMPPGCRIFPTELRLAAAVFHRFQPTW